MSKARVLHAVLDLVDENRLLRADSDERDAKRKREFEAHVSSLHAIIDAQSREIAVLRERVIALSPPIAKRSVAAEMGLRSPGQEAEARFKASQIDERERESESRQEGFGALLSGAEQLREGMAVASGLVADREPDQNG